MVFKSPSVPEAINLQDTLHLCSALTDSAVAIAPKHRANKELVRREERIQSLRVKRQRLHLPVARPGVGAVAEKHWVFFAVALTGKEKHHG